MKKPIYIDLNFLDRYHIARDLRNFIIANSLLGLKDQVFLDAVGDYGNIVEGLRSLIKVIRSDESLIKFDNRDRIISIEMTDVIQTTVYNEQGGYSLYNNNELFFTAIEDTKGNTVTTTLIRPDGVQLLDYAYNENNTLCAVTSHGIPVVNIEYGDDKRVIKEEFFIDGENTIVNNYDHFYDTEDNLTITKYSNSVKSQVFTISVKGQQRLADIDFLPDEDNISPDILSISGKSSDERKRRIVTLGFFFILILILIFLDISYTSL